jgi:hypothetical protein
MGRKILSKADSEEETQMSQLARKSHIFLTTYP